MLSCIEPPLQQSLLLSSFIRDKFRFARSEHRQKFSFDIFFINVNLYVNQYDVIRIHYHMCLWVMCALCDVPCSCSKHGVTAHTSFILHVEPKTSQKQRKQKMGRKNRELNVNKPSTYTWQAHAYLIGSKARCLGVLTYYEH